MLRRVLLLIASCASVLSGAPRTVSADELAVVAGYSTGGDDATQEFDTRSLTLRYVVGDTTQLRAEMAALQVRDVGAVVRLGWGPSPVRRKDSGGPSGPGGPGEPEAGGWTSGLGDLRVALSRALAGGGAKLFRVDAAAQVKAPTADEKEGLGTGEWDVRAGVSGEYRFWSVAAFGGVGWNRLGDPAWVELNDVVDAYLGLEGLAFGERVIVSGWMDGHAEIVDGVGPAGALGLELRANQRRRWRGVVTAGLGDAAEDFGVLFGYSFSPGGRATGYRGMLR